MEFHWKSCPVPAVRDKVKVAKMSSLTEERQSVPLWDISYDQNEVGTLWLLLHYCLNDPFTQTAQRKETRGLIPQWKGIQGI